MPALEILKAFDVNVATVAVWTFKKSSPAGAPPRFTGRWIETTDELDAAIKSAILSYRDGIEETIPYDILAQNNEASVLAIEAAVTHSDLILQEMVAETDARKVTKIKDINNSSFYVFKLINNGGAIYAVRRTDNSWRTQKSAGIMSAVFQDNILDIDDRPSFNISKYIDFFIIGNEILIGNKGNFESVLAYKEAHKNDFITLQQEPEFLAALTDVAPLVAYVGDNKIQLRRALAIKEKGHYKNPNFLSSLRANCVQFELDIAFDATGKIIATPESCRDIFLALLDHRLMSHFSNKIYDVPSTVAVN